MAENDVATLYGATVVDESGSKVGKVGQVYLDDQTSRPEWVTVSTGLFGTNETFIPVRTATVSGSEVRVPYSKSFIKDAPNLDPESGHLDEAQEDELYRYYGIGESSYAQTDTTTTTTTQRGGVAGAVAGAAETVKDRVTGDRDDRTNRHGTVGHDTSGPTTDDAMTRSEEQLRVGTERVSAGRARLRKYVVTENVTQTVPVSREEVRVTREPITDANRGAAYDGPAISEEEHEVTLTAERPVVEKEAVPVERVRLDKETVTGQETVGGEVRKEEIEFVGGDETVRGTGDTRR